MWGSVSPGNTPTTGRANYCKVMPLSQSLPSSPRPGRFLKALRSGGPAPQLLEAWLTCQGLTLFLLTAELGHNSRRESEELCSSLHTCHRKWRKEPPAAQVEAHQHRDPCLPAHSHLHPGHTSQQAESSYGVGGRTLPGHRETGRQILLPLGSWATLGKSLPTPQ